MSSTLYISAESSVPGLELNAIDRPALAAEFLELTLDAVNLCVTPLDDFISYTKDEVAGLLDDEEAESMDVDGIEARWFDPADALLTLRALRKHVTLPRPGHVTAPKMVYEIDDCIAVLVALHARNVRFRFHLGG